MPGFNTIPDFVNLLLALDQNNQPIMGAISRHNNISDIAAFLAGGEYDD